MLTENRVKRVIREGKIAFSAWVSFCDPAVVEIMGYAGFDAASIDMEHTAFDLSVIQQMVRACEGVGITPLVRVPDENPKTILRVLDMGAQGIQVPHVQNAEQARALVRAVRYPPLGDRGVSGGSHAAGYGAVPWAEHVERSNREILLIVMVEGKVGIGNLDSIASVDGVDIVSVGPNDLAESLALQDNFPAMRKVYQDISNRMRHLGRAGLGVPTGARSAPFTAKDLKAMGVAFASVQPHMSARILKSFKDELAKFRAELGQA